MNTGCKNKNEIINSPLSSVIKLETAEELGEFEVAKKFINIDRVYSSFAKEKLTTPENYWREYINGINALAEDPKFTNKIKYYDYDIIEIVKGKSACVILKGKQKNIHIKEIIYSLEKIKNNWVVQKIEYKH